MNKNLCALRRAADEVKPFVSEPMWAELDAAIRRLEPQARIAKPKGPDRKSERKAARRYRMAATREAVMARADGRCEWCGAQNMALEAHHVIGGGARRAEERPETVAAICWDCHRAAHRSDLDTLGRARAWANRNDFREAYAAIERRYDKAHAARFAPSVPVRLVVGER